MSRPIVTALPPAPQRTDLPSVFSNKADLFVAALSTFVSDTNQLSAWINSTGITIQNNVDFATLRAGEAEEAATQATDAANIAVDAAESVELITEAYKGKLSADPSSAEAGDWYISTVTGYIRAYTGSAWVNGIDAIAGVESLNGQIGNLTGFTENDATQTLTNKTLTLPVLSPTASGSVAGRLGYSSSGLSYGHGGSQRIVVDTNSTQTLTNKTISYSSNELNGVQSTLVSGNDIKTINGESVLGSGNIALSAGSQVLLAVYNCAGASIIEVENFSDLYDTYRIIGSGITGGVAGTGPFRYLMKFGTGSYATSGYFWETSLGAFYGQTSSARSENASYAAVATTRSVSSTTDQSLLPNAEISNSFDMSIKDANSPFYKSVMSSVTAYSNNMGSFPLGAMMGTSHAVCTAGASSAPLRGIRFYVTSGTIATGNIYIFGIKKSL